MQGYVDSDYAGCGDSHKSTNGWIYAFAGLAISWRLILQNFISVSTIDAEYIATSEACKEAIWLTRLVGEFDILQKILVLHSDSQSAIALAMNPVFHS